MNSEWIVFRKNRPRRNIAISRLAPANKVYFIRIHVRRTIAEFCCTGKCRYIGFCTTTVSVCINFTTDIVPIWIWVLVAI